MLQWKLYFLTVRRVDCIFKSFAVKETSFAFPSNILIHHGFIHRCESSRGVDPAVIWKTISLKCPLHGCDVDCHPPGNFDDFYLCYHPLLAVESGTICPGYCAVYYGTRVLRLIQECYPAPATTSQSSLPRTRHYWGRGGLHRLHDQRPLPDAVWTSCCYLNWANSCQTSQDTVSWTLKGLLFASHLVFTDSIRI